MEEDNPFEKSKTVDPEVRAYVYSLVTAVSSNVVPPATIMLTRTSLEEQVSTQMGNTCWVTMRWPACET